MNVGSTWRHKVRKSVMEVTGVDDTYVHFKCIIGITGQPIRRRDLQTFTTLERFQRCYEPCDRPSLPTLGDSVRSTRTFATLEVSPCVFDEIEHALKAAGYDHAFIDGRIDMHGIALERRAEVGVDGGKPPTKVTPP